MGVMIVAIAAIVILIIVFALNGKARLASDVSEAGYGDRNPLPRGIHERTTCDIIEGWACDRNSLASPIGIKLYADRPYDRGGTLLGTYTAGITRDDVAGRCGGFADHGFSVDTPSHLKDGNRHRVYAYGVDIDDSRTPTGALALLNNSPQNIQCRLSPTPTAPTSTLSPTPTPTP